MHTEFALTENLEDENSDNFCVRTPILANLGFLKSLEKVLSNGDHKAQEVVRDKISNRER
jgi:hypothetical protein